MTNKETLKHMNCASSDTEAKYFTPEEGLLFPEV